METLLYVHKLKLRLLCALVNKQRPFELNLQILCVQLFMQNGAQRGIDRK